MLRIVPKPIVAILFVLGLALVLSACGAETPSTAQQGSGVAPLPPPVAVTVLAVLALQVRPLGSPLPQVPAPHQRCHL